MSNLNELITKKNKLLTQIRRIEESCEGIENEANAHRVAELNEQQMKLSTSKRDLQGKLAAIESELNVISSKIQELSGTGVDRILEAIKNQRWFYFKGKPKVIFDKNTALLWADLQYFPWRKNQSNDAYGLGEISNLLNNINSEGIDGYNTWHVPTPFELWNLVYDKSFPYQSGTNWRIQGCDYWCVDYNNQYHSKDLYDDGATSDIGNTSVYLIPCCSYLVTHDYEENISPSNNFYKEKEKLQFTLNIFVTNGLIPMFNDEDITHLYRQIYVEKPALMAQLSTLQSEINALQEVTLLSSTFDYRGLLTNYDIPAINESIIKYHKAITSLAETFLVKLSELENEKKVTIREFDAAGLKLDVPYSEQEELSDEENETLETRRHFLARHLSLNMESVKQQIRSVKQQGEAFAARIDDINRGKSSLQKLAQLNNEVRPQFSLVAENLAYVVWKALKKIEFFEAHHDFALSLIDTWADWEASCLAFKNEQRKTFLEACSEHGISDAVGESYFGDWAVKRLAVEKAFLPLAEYIMKDNLLHNNEDEPTVAEKVLDLLKKYQEDLDGFYNVERWRINAEFCSAADFGRREKLEMEKAFYWRSAHWMKENWSELLFSLADPDERIFLARWLHPLLDLPMVAVLDYVREHEELSLSLGVTSDLMAMQGQDVRHLLKDKDSYCEELNERGHKFENIIARIVEEWANAPAPNAKVKSDTDKPEDGMMIITKNSNEEG